MLTKENFFTTLSNLEVEKSKKWKFDYSSWSDVWSELKKHVPDANFEWIENKEWTLGLVDDYWCFAKVRVFSDSLWVDATQYLHAMDFNNRAIQKDKLTAWEINKTYQRCMVKAIAVWFWLGLYIYKWEDFPDESDWENKKEMVKEEKKPYTPKTSEPSKSDRLLEAIQKATDVDKLMELQPHIDTTCVSDKQKAFFRAQFTESYKRLNKEGL